MTTIGLKDGSFVINGVSSHAVSSTLKQSGIGDAAIAEIIGGWLVGATGAVSPSPFRFTTNVQTTDPACEVTYARQFSHVDWVDGESRVQAGMTPEELGVNARFHAIENEFDTVAAQLASLGSCGKELRADLVGVVRELEAKITTLQNEVHGLRKEQKPATKPEIIGTINVGGKEQFITQFGDKFNFVEVQTSVMKDPVGPRVNPSRTYRPDEVHPGGILDLVAGLANVLEQPSIRDIFPGSEPITVGELRRHASDVVLPTGESLGSVIATLPADTTFTGADDAVARITEHLVAELPAATATELKATILSTEAEGRTGAALLNSGVSSVAIDPAASAALAASGITTVGRLSTASRSDIASALDSAGLDPSAAAGIHTHGVLGRALRGIG
jgi:hypothetical protein